MELGNCAAAWALQDGCSCRTLGISNEAAAELLKFLICKSKHEPLQGLPGQHMFPSSKLAALLQWACDNPQVNCTGSLRADLPRCLTHTSHATQHPCAILSCSWGCCRLLAAVNASEVVCELVGGPVEAVAAGRSQDGLSDTDVLMQQLYALNVMAQGRYTPSLALWQVCPVCSCRRLVLPSEPLQQHLSACTRGRQQRVQTKLLMLLLRAVVQEPNAPLIVAAAGAGPVAFTSQALSGQKQQQLAADVQVGARIALLRSSSSSPPTCLSDPSTCGKAKRRLNTLHALHSHMCLCTHLSLR